MAAGSIGLNRYGRAAIEFGWMVGGRALALVASLIYIRITAQYLGKSDYGLLAVIVGIANTLYVLVGSPLNIPITRIVNENGDRAAGLRSLVGGYFWWSVIVSGAAALLLATGSHLLWPGAALPLFAIAAIPLFVAFYTLYGIINSVFIAWRARTVTASVQCSLAWLRVLFTLPLIWLAIATPSNIFVVSAVAFLPLLVVQVWLLHRRQPEALSRAAALPSELKARYWPLVQAHAPQVWINASMFFVDKPLFALVLPLETVAVYAVMQQIARALSSLFIEMGVQFLMPYAFRGATRGSRLQLLSSVALIVASALIAGAMYVAGDVVVSAVASRKYAGVDPLLLAAMTFGVCLSFAVNALELKGFADFSVGRYTLGHLLQAAVFLGGGLYAGLRYGLAGVTSVLVVAVIARLIVVLFFNMRSPPSEAGSSHSQS